MMHGLARTGRDFDELAAALSDSYHVLCPDMIGRGRSSWASDPDGEYTIEYYSGIACDLMDYYNIDRCSWLGTSMGGQVGMRMASGTQSDRITCLLLNDIGPEVPPAAVERILSYVGTPPHFDSYAEAQNWLRAAYAPFGPAADRFWQRLTRSSLRRCGDGRLTLHYDPAIIRQLHDAADELAIWDRWARITTPSYLFYGAQSDLLTDDIRMRMLASGPKPRHRGFADCGHAPTLSRPADIALVRAVLAELSP
jgi:pimeloyl-ACP methyl ester carboxylesterase